MFSSFLAMYLDKDTTVEPLESLTLWELKDSQFSSSYLNSGRRKGCLGRWNAFLVLPAFLYTQKHFLRTLNSEYNPQSLSCMHKPFFVPKGTARAETEELRVCLCVAYFDSEALEVWVETLLEMQGIPLPGEDAKPGVLGGNVWDPSQPGKDAQVPSLHFGHTSAPWHTWDVSGTLSTPCLFSYFSPLSSKIPPPLFPLAEVLFRSRPQHKHRLVYEAFPPVPCHSAWTPLLPHYRLYPLEQQPPGRTQTHTDTDTHSSNTQTRTQTYTPNVSSLKSGIAVSFSGISNTQKMPWTMKALNIVRIIIKQTQPPFHQIKVHSYKCASCWLFSFASFFVPVQTQAFLKNVCLF